MEQPLTSNTAIRRKYLFYGPPGSGKTTTAASMPHPRKLFIDIDHKLDSMENLTDAQRTCISLWTPSEMLSNADRIDVIRQERVDSQTRKKIIGTEAYVPKNPRGYLDTINYINDLLARDPFNFDLVVLDSFTVLVDHLVKLILSHHKTAVFSLPLWGVYKSNFQEFMSGFLSLPCDKIMIGHSKMTQDDVTKEINVRPMLDGQMADNIGMLFNEVYYFNGFNRSRNTYTVLTRADRKYMARTSRLGLDPEASIEDMIRVANT